MNVGTWESERSGNMRQMPTASMKLRASSSVRTARPSVRQSWDRCCWSSDSVISNTLEGLLNVLHRISQHYWTAMRAAHGTFGFGQLFEQPVHFILLKGHVDLDSSMAGDTGGNARAN